MNKEPVEWAALLNFLQSNAGKTFEVYIPVTEHSFGHLGRFSGEIPSLVKNGYIYGCAVFEDNIVTVRYCIEEADRGDEYGYGIEPDEWIVGKIDLEGNFIVPFHLT